MPIELITPAVPTYLWILVHFWDKGETAIALFVVLFLGDDNLKECLNFFHLYHAQILYPSEPNHALRKTITLLPWNVTSYYAKVLPV